MNSLPRKVRNSDNPLGLMNVRDDLHRLVDMISHGDFGLEPLRDWGKFLPALDVIEEDDAVIVKADVPGLDPKDIDISISGQNLTIKGEKAEEKEEEGKNYHRSERRYGAFTRTVSLPTNVDADKIRAEYSKGVLKIVLPKVQAERPKRIPIKSED